MSVALDVAGPVEAEVLVVVERDGRLWLTGPCGPAPWRMEGAGGDPTDVVARLAADALDDLVLVHSTSWRWFDGAVVLTYLAVVATTSRPRVPIARVDLARGTTDAAPDVIGSDHVIEHALRHLAWLAGDDDVVRAALSPPWHAALGDYLPAPFQHLHAGQPQP